MEKHCLWVSRSGLLSRPSYSPGPPVRDAAAYGGLGPGSQTSEKENTPQPGPLVNLGRLMNLGGGSLLPGVRVAADAG